MDPVFIKALRLRTKLSHHPPLQVTVDEAQAEELRETRFYQHTIFWPCHLNHRWPLAILTLINF